MGFSDIRSRIQNVVANIRSRRKNVSPQPKQVLSQTAVLKFGLRIFYLIVVVIGSILVWAGMNSSLYRIQDSYKDIAIVKTVKRGMFRECIRELVGTAYQQLCGDYNPMPQFIKVSHGIYGVWVFFDLLFIAFEILILVFFKENYLTKLGRIIQALLSAISLLLLLFLIIYFSASISSYDIISEHQYFGSAYRTAIAGLIMCIVGYCGVNIWIDTPDPQDVNNKQNNANANSFQNNQMAYPPTGSTPIVNQPMFYPVSPAQFSTVPMPYPNNQIPLPNNQMHLTPPYNLPPMTSGVMVNDIGMNVSHPQWIPSNMNIRNTYGF